MQIELLFPGDPLWPVYVTHLERVNQAAWVLEADGKPKAGIIFLGAVTGKEVVGHISLKIQPITVPVTEWSGGQEFPLTDPDGNPLTETFVQTFAVEEAQRRQGYGRALQVEALDLTHQLGCCQMRSWSSLDKPENYTLKLSLGFAMHPATQTLHNGQVISGVYFVKRV